ncbi:MAG TPA: hypothetical protein VFO76_08275 [Candidatus Kapabacteria bacterium]|nr:hypothetical protein [Candidatus Kapabacteria bacterium]
MKTLISFFLLFPCLMVAQPMLQNLTPMQVRATIKKLYQAQGIVGDTTITVHNESISITVDSSDQAPCFQPKYSSDYVDKDLEGNSLLKYQVYNGIQIFGIVGSFKVFYSKKQICIGAEFTADSGKSIKKEFDRIKDSISTKFGKNRDLDSKENSIMAYWETKKLGLILKLFEGWISFTYAVLK